MRLSIRRKEYIYISFEMIHMQIEGHRLHSYLFKQRKFKKKVRMFEVRQEYRKKKKEKIRVILASFFSPTRFNNYDHSYFVKF